MPRDVRDDTITFDEHNPSCRVVDAGVCRGNRTHRHAIHFRTTWRWGQQWTIVKMSYRMAQAYERRYSVEFAYLLRVRPDLLFVRDAPPLAAVAPRGEEVLVPLGIATQRYNDHLAICARAGCARYFNEVDLYTNCTANLTFGFEVRSAIGQCKPVDDWMHWMGFSRKNTNLQESAEFVYTIFRHCPDGGECRRMRQPGSEGVCHAETVRICKGGHTAYHPRWDPLVLE